MDGWRYLCMYGWMEGRRDGGMETWRYLCMYGTLPPQGGKTELKSKPKTSSPGEPALGGKLPSPYCSRMHLQAWPVLCGGRVWSVLCGLWSSHGSFACHRCSLSLRCRLSVASLPLLCRRSSIVPLSLLCRSSVAPLSLLCRSSAAPLSLLCRCCVVALALLCRSSVAPVSPPFLSFRKGKG